MTPFLYDSVGVNAGIFHALYRLNGPVPDALWRLLSFGYGYWMAGVAGLAIVVLYLRNRKNASPRQSDVRAQVMAELILAFSLIWCAVYTMQSVILWPRPWMAFPEAVAQPAVFLWHEGFPASAPAIATMIATVCWPYASRKIKQGLALYVATGSVLCIVSGQNWPADVVAGLLIGYAGVKLARRYYQLATRLVAV